MVRICFYIVLTILYLGKLEVSAEAFNFGQCMDGFLVVYLTQLQEVEFQVGHRAEVRARGRASQRYCDSLASDGEKSASRDRDDYAFLHFIIVFADLQCGIDEPAAVKSARF